MLFTNAGLQPGGTVLVQGAGGGVATALVQLGSAAGYRMWVTSPRRGQGRARRGDRRGPRLRQSGARLPDRVDAVMETVGAATWSHSINSPAPRRDASSSRGATSGDAPPQGRADQDLLPPAAGRRAPRWAPASELERLAQFVAHRGIEPVVDSVHPLAEARDGFARMVDGEVFGKVVFTV